MKTNPKSILKSGYYYEEKPWYDTLPDKLKIPTYKEEIFPKVMSHREIIETYHITPYDSYEKAASVMADVIPTLKYNYKSRIVYFKENDTFYRFHGWRFDFGELKVHVNEVSLDDEYDAEDGVVFSRPLEVSKEALSSSDALPFELRIEGWIYRRNRKVDEL